MTQHTHSCKSNHHPQLDITLQAAIFHVINKHFYIAQFKSKWHFPPNIISSLAFVLLFSILLVSILVFSRPTNQFAYRLCILVTDVSSCLLSSSQLFHTRLLRISSHQNGSFFVLFDTGPSWFLWAAANFSHVRYFVTYNTFNWSFQCAGYFI